VIAAFPYSLAFSADTVEVRSPINGSLLQTLTLPKLNLIASKEDIFFTTTKVVRPRAFVTWLSVAVPLVLIVKICLLRTKNVSVDL
jgi:hypothetical protein